MRAIICEQFASPENLSIVDVPDPVAGPNEVLVRIEATGLGYVDALTVAGLYQLKPELPFIPGNETTGVIEQTGEAVKHLRPGQRILATPSSGGLAELICLPETACIVVPDALPAEVAASFLINYCTAYHGLSYCGQLQSKENILILGASGGVGMAAIDVAKAMGARVIAAASTKAKREACIKAGADNVINYNRKNWRDELKTVLAGEPLNVVYDPVGGDYSEPALRSLAAGGRFLVVGFASGSIARLPLNLPLLKRISIIGVNWGGFVAANPRESRPVITTLLQWITAGKLTPMAGQTFSLSNSGKAMMKMLDRKAIGKIVITP